MWNAQVIFVYHTSFHLIHVHENYSTWLQQRDALLNANAMLTSLIAFVYHCYLLTITAIFCLFVRNLCFQNTSRNLNWELLFQCSIPNLESISTWSILETKQREGDRNWKIDHPSHLIGRTLLSDKMCGVTNYAFKKESSIQKSLSSKDFRGKNI